jgi:hypothetical protein
MLQSFFFCRQICLFPLILKWSRLSLLIFISFTSLYFKSVAASAEGTISINVLNEQPVYIYYFFFTPRCDECIILEKALQKVLNGNYSQELKSKRLIFKMIDLTNPDSESKKIIKELGVRRQLLLLVSGETKVNLTKDAFRYAENQYDHFRDFIKTAIDQVLTQ